MRATTIRFGATGRWFAGTVATVVTLTALAALPWLALPSFAASADGARTDAGIAWHEATTVADVDAALARAKAENKPTFVYWGAKWCPPCNQVKATLFNRQDFIERSKSFVPVYVDGDSPGAQKIGARFRVSGYPTMVLFDPQGREVTRLPGEVDPARYAEVLTLGMDSTRPVRALLDDALARPKALTPNDWRLLAFYSWDTDQQQLKAKAEVPATLAALADACPPELRDTALRLRLKALAAADARSGVAEKDQGDKGGVGKAAARNEVLALLADARATRGQTDLLAGYAAEIVRALSAKGTPERKRLLAAFDVALQRLAADPTLSRADRMQALIARVDLVRIDVAAGDAGASKPVQRRAAPPAMPASLLAEIRARTAADDREITDGYERQAVITAAAYLLEHAGLGAESDRLLEANLAKSHSPYYLMSELASNARKRGDVAEALRWYREAFAKSEGPATRLQWGASYVAALVDLKPADEAAIEGATTELWREAATRPDAFFQRSARSLQRVGGKLVEWNKRGTHAAAMGRLQARLEAMCAAPGRAEDERATCRALLAAPVKGKSA